MRIEILDEDVSSGDLSNRIHGKKPKKQQPELTARLAAANPHIANLETIPKGTPILVPDDDPASDARLGAAIGLAQKLLDDTAAVRRGRLEEQTTALGERAALIKSARPGFANDATITAKLDDLDKAAKKSTDDLKKQKGQVDEQLNALRKRAVESAPTGQPSSVK